MREQEDKHCTHLISDLRLCSFAVDFNSDHLEAVLRRVPGRLVELLQIHFMRLWMYAYS